MAEHFSNSPDHPHYTEGDGEKRVRDQRAEVETSNERAQECKKDHERAREKHAQQQRAHQQAYEAYRKALDEESAEEVVKIADANRKTTAEELAVVEGNCQRTLNSAMCWLLHVAN